MSRAESPARTLHPLRPACPMKEVSKDPPPPPSPRFANEGDQRSHSQRSRRSKRCRCAKSAATCGRDADAPRLLCSSCGAQARCGARELAATCHSAAVTTAKCLSRFSEYHSTHGCECEEMSPRRSEEKSSPHRKPRGGGRTAWRPPVELGESERHGEMARCPERHGALSRAPRRVVPSATARWQELLTSPEKTVAQVPAGSPQVVSRRRRERRSCGDEQAAATAGGPAAGPQSER